jgi:hypothetical protein
MAVRDGIIIPDPLPLDRCVRATQSFFVDMGFAPGSPGTRERRCREIERDGKEAA